MWQNNRNNNNRHNNSIANDLVVNDSEQRIIITSSMQISSSNDSILPVNQMDDLTSESTGSNVNVTIDPNTNVQVSVSNDSHTTLSDLNQSTTYPSAPLVSNYIQREIEAKNDRIMTLVIGESDVKVQLDLWNEAIVQFKSTEGKIYDDFKFN